jgi:hypothetical protein
MESVETWRTHYRRGQRKLYCGKERMKKLLRNDRQLNKISRRQPAVA